MLSFPIQESRDQLRTALRHARSLGILDQLRTALRRLGEYANTAGCTYDRALGKNTRALLYPDFAPFSFSVVMQRQESPDAPWQPWWGGGLIFQGPTSPANGGGPSFTVSMNPTQLGWFLHT